MLSLSDILHSPVKEGDRAEKTRRELLYRFLGFQTSTFVNISLTEDTCRRLADVIVKLEPLSEQNGLLRFLQNQDHAALLSGFVQEVAEAITDYQVCYLKARTSLSLTTPKTSLQQNTYENTREIQELVRTINQTTAENADKTREMTVSVVGETIPFQMLTFSS